MVWGLGFGAGGDEDEESGVAGGWEWDCVLFTSFLMYLRNVRWDRLGLVLCLENQLSKFAEKG